MALHPDAARALRYLLRPFGREVTAAAEARSSGSAGDTGMRLSLEMAALLSAAAGLALPLPAGDEQLRQEVPWYLRTAVADVMKDARCRVVQRLDGVVELEVLVRLALMLVAVSDQPRPAAEVYLRRVFEREIAAVQANYQLSRRRLRSEYPGLPSLC